MQDRKIRLLILLSWLFVIVNLNAQQQDNISPIRDNIGDLNEDAIKKGEFPGAIKLPGTDVSLAIGGFVKAVAFYDSKYNIKNEIIFPGNFSGNDIYKGQTYIGARSSRLFFDGRSTINNLNMRGYYEMDFRGNSGFTLRHAYLQLRNSNGLTLLMGQYWSLVMDLQGVPEGLVEPTISGAGFARHGQIRVTTPLSKTLTVSAAVEEPDNLDLKGVNMSPLNKYPDIIAHFAYDPTPQIHLGLTGLYRPVIFIDQTDNSERSAKGYFTSITTVIKPNTSDKFILSGMYGSGASNYIMGGDGTSGFYDNYILKLQSQYGGYCSFRHYWNSSFRSNIAAGRFWADEIINNPNPHIKSSTYAFINSYYKLNRYVNIGVEWIYSEKENYKGEHFNNNRFQFGIQVF